MELFYSNPLSITTNISIKVLSILVDTVNKLPLLMVNLDNSIHRGAKFHVHNKTEKAQQ